MYYVYDQCSFTELTSVNQLVLNFKQAIRILFYVTVTL